MMFMMIMQSILMYMMCMMIMQSIIEEQHHLFSLQQSADVVGCSLHYVQTAKSEINI